MARLDVYPMPGKGKDGYVVDVQANLLSDLATQTVVPLLSENVAPKPISELNPVFEIDSKRYVLVTQAIASVPRHELKRAIASLDSHHDSITCALDTLVLGF